MSKLDLGEVHAAIMSGFDEAELTKLLRFKLGIRFRDVVGNVGFDEAVTKLLDHLDQLEGPLVKLVKEMSVARPLNSKVQAVYATYSTELFSDAWRNEVDVTTRKAYIDTFGQEPPVVIQSGGAAEATVPTSNAGLERTVRETLGFLDVGRWLRLFATQAGRVCRVELNDADGIMGTGFLVGPDVLLTNYHVMEKVIKGSHQADLVKFRFDFRTQADGTPGEGKLVGLAAAGDRKQWQLGFAPYSDAEKTGNPDAQAPTADQLDYSLVRLDRKIGEQKVDGDGSTRGWIFVPEAQPPLGGLPALMILQHPQLRKDRKPEPLMLAFDTNPQVELRHGGLRVRYATNTEWGSSGSPCFNKDWDLIALHHYGDPAFGQPKYNQGIPIGLIRAHLGEPARSALGGRFL